jgi:hypothetical protein
MMVWAKIVRAAPRAESTPAMPNAAARLELEIACLAAANDREPNEAKAGLDRIAADFGQDEEETTLLGERTFIVTTSVLWATNRPVTQPVTQPVT